MPKNTKATTNTSGAAFRTLTGDTYNAYIEWPIYLMLRRCELQKHLAVTTPGTTPAQPSVSASPAPARSVPVRPSVAAKSAPIPTPAPATPILSDPSPIPAPVAQSAEAADALGDFLSDF